MAAPVDHPLPAPPPQQQANFYQQQTQHQQQYQPVQQPYPQQQQQQQQQPYRQQYAVQPTRPAPVQRTNTKSRTFSFRSDKSQKSTGNQKVELIETHAEKEAKRLHSKADPTLAMNEAEPSAVQANIKSSLAPLRSIQHKDAFGNAIADPDKSNPTRNRWERPLDTIRSFEAAIDGGYSRKSYIRSDSESVAWNRRSSYYGNHAPRFPNDSYYSRPQSFRPESGHFEGRYHNRDSYAESNGHGYGHGPGPGPNRQRAPRMQSEPHMSGAYARPEHQNIYPMPNKDRSYETVTSAAASGSSGDPSGYHTDPTSSENSSIDRRSPGKRPEAPPVNDYGIGFSQGGAYQPPAFNFSKNGGGPVPHANGIPPRVPVHMNSTTAAPPPVPRKESTGLLRRMTSQQQQQAPQQRPDMGEKRKSWFSRRFSKAS